MMREYHGGTDKSGNPIDPDRPSIAAESPENYAGCFAIKNDLIGMEILTDQNRIVAWYDGPIAFYAKDRTGHEYLFRMVDQFYDPRYGYIERFEVEIPSPSVEDISTLPMVAWIDIPYVTNWVDICWRYRDSDADLDYDGYVVRAWTLKDKGRLYHQSRLHAFTGEIDGEELIFFPEKEFHKGCGG